MGSGRVVGTVVQGLRCGDGCRVGGNSRGFFNVNGSPDPSRGLFENGDSQENNDVTIGDFVAHVFIDADDTVLLDAGILHDLLCQHARDVVRPIGQDGTESVPIRTGHTLHIDHLHDHGWGRVWRFPDLGDHRPNGTRGERRGGRHAVAI